MLIVGCSGGTHLSQALAKKLRAKHTTLEVKNFPDGESYVRLKKDPKNEIVVLVQSFYGAINDKLIEVLFAAHTAKRMKAKKVVLLAPYFPYLRQDKAFFKGETISIKALGSLFSTWFDHIMIMDPHLHRTRRLNDVIHCDVTRLSADPLIETYIRKHIPNPIIIGPDMESYQWAKTVATNLQCEYAILRKTRRSSTDVTVHFNKKIDAKGKNLVIIDDIISTGNTLIQAVKGLRKQGIKDVTCIGVHGIFMLQAVKKLDKAKVKTIATNTLPNSKSKIDIIPELVKILSETF